MSEELRFSIDLPVSPERVYRAWLDGAEQTRITGQPAQVVEQVGGNFSIFAGKVTGKFLALSPFDRIVQTWMMQDLPVASESQLELCLEPTCTGTQFVLFQSGIPDGQSKRMLQWWEQNYLRPMSDYFEELVGDYVADIEG